jgi:hypothetical protein
VAMWFYVAENTPVPLCLCENIVKQEVSHGE